MLSQAEVKFLKSLKLKKFRLKYQKILLEGDKLVRRTLLRGYPHIESIYALQSWIETNETQLKLAGIQINSVEEVELDRITAFKSPSPVAALAKLPPGSSSPIKTGNAPFSLYLDNIRDPGNLGTIFRIADWFGVKGIYCSPGCAEQWNPKVVRASMGSVFEVPTYYQVFEKLILEREFDCIIGTGVAGVPLKQYEWSHLHALVIVGNEARGVSNEIMEECQVILTISGRPQARAESLNAAISVGILCHQFL